MTVLVVSRCLPLPAWHGDRLIVRHLIDGLRARHHRVVLVALTRAGDEPFVEVSRAACDRLEVMADRPRTPVTFAATAWNPFPRVAAESYAPDVFARIDAVVGEERPDVVHFIGGIQVSVFREAVRGVPRVITPYESHALWQARAATAAPGVAGRLARRARAMAAGVIERRIFEGFARVVVLTDVDARMLATLQPRLPLHVIPNGVTAPARVTPIVDRREPLIVFAGNMSYAPNVDAAQRLAGAILPAVQAIHRDARLALVGAVPSEAVCRLARHDVVVTGTVDDVFPWLDRARVVVVPLTYGAGMKNKVLEALAAGAPVVATPQGCDGIGVQDGIHAVLRHGAAELAAATARVLGDVSLAQSLAERGRALVCERFTWPAVVEAYERLYAEARAS